MEIYTPPDVREKRPPGRRPKHSESYQQMVAKKLLEEGMSYREAGKLYGISHGSIANILKKYQNKKFNSKRQEVKSKYKKEVENYRHQAHVKDLKLEIADLYLENLMLKKMLENWLQKKKFDSSEITSENLDLLPEDAK